jgi:hypothetical protein
MPLRAYARAGCALFLALAAACSDRENPLGPELPEPGPSEMAQLQCTAVVAEATVTCVPVQPGGARADRLIGGQDVYVRLASFGTAYDGTLNFTSNVTVQNLTQNVVGTTTGTDTSGVRVFFASGPTRTGGTGNVSVVPDGVGTFTEAGQAYYAYNQILDPYEISDSKLWLFEVDNTVTTFVFTVYVALTMVDESAALLGPVWEGDVDSNWQTAGNWSGGAVPTADSTVSIPSDSLFAGAMPVLTADGDALNVRVGYQSSLGLGGFTLTVGGNVDAVGAISGGTVVMSGTGALLKGTVDALNVTGSTSLQGAARATGAVSVTGSLNLNGNALTIAVP